MDRTGGDDVGAQGAATEHAGSGMLVGTGRRQTATVVAVTTHGGSVLRVDAGEVVAVTGDGASAVMTSVRNVPRIGDRTLDGLAVAEATALRRRLVGTVCTDHRLVPSLTVLENTALPLELDGWDTHEAIAAATTALVRVGVTAPSDALPDDLTAAEQRLVTVARSIAASPVLVLADEPRDATVVRLLRRVAGDGAGVLVSTTAAARPTWADRLVETPAAIL